MSMDHYTSGASLHTIVLKQGEPYTKLTNSETLKRLRRLSMALETVSITTSPQASVIILTIFASIIVALFYTLRRPLRLPPGPLGLPLLGSLPFLSPDLNRSFTALARTHGPVLSLRLGSRLCVVLASPSAARAVLKTHDAVFANPHPPAVAMYGGVDMVWSPLGPLWQTLRKASVKDLLSPASLEVLRRIRRREVRRGIGRVLSKTGTEVNVLETVFAIALGVMQRMLWGEEDGEEREFREVVEGVVELLGAVNVSDFWPAVARWDLQGLGSRMKGFEKRFDRMFEGIMERRGGGGGSRDFLGVLLEIMERGEGEVRMTMDHVKALLMDLVIGGTDTTSTTIEWAMAQLLCNPAKMKKAQVELDTIVGNNRVLEETDIPRLQYLAAIVKETLRLHPVVPLLVPHYPSSDATIEGYHIPKGTKIFINVWAIQRDPSLWEDPLEFKPERFLNATEKYDYKGNNFSFLPFGSGRRVCPAISLAEKMVAFILGSLLHSFDWRSPEGRKVDLSEKFGVVLNMKEPLVAVPTLRQDTLALDA